MRLRRRVAVKVLHAALAGDEQFLRRFRAEAQAAASLNHPNILAVYDWGEDQGTPYLVTEYLAGGSLRAILDAGELLTTSQALLVGLEAVRALEAAHRQGFVHRDIKPANLLFGQDGRLRVADFGLARALAEAAWTEPAGAVLGTARYASPEQARGEAVDGRADVYTLGLVLIEAVTGSVPFATDTTIGTLMARVERAVEVPDALGPLARLLRAAGRPDPAERPDARALATSLMACANDLPRPEPLPLRGAMAAAPGGERAGDETMLGLPGSVLAEAEAGTGGATAREGSHGVLAGSSVSNHADLDPPGTGVDGTATADALADRPGDEPTVVAANAASAATVAAPVAAAPLPAPGVERPTRRRRLRVAVLAVLVAALVGTGVAFAVDAARSPSYEVPVLAGRTEAEARRLVDPYGWKISVVNERRDRTAAGQVLGTRPGAGDDLSEGDTLTLVVSQGWTLAPVPELVGRSAEEARAALEQAGFVPDPSEAFHETARPGVVVSSSVGVGTELERNSPVAYVVSKGPEPRTVPDGLAGSEPSVAIAALERIGLVVARTDEFDDQVAAGKVIGTRPGAGSSVPRGATVALVVSRGPDVVSVPSVRNLSLDEAAARLEAAGLTVGNVFGPAKGKAFETSPTSATVVGRGTTVNIYLR